MKESVYRMSSNSFEVMTGGRADLDKYDQVGFLRGFREVVDAEAIGAGRLAQVLQIQECFRKALMIVRRRGKQICRCHRTLRVSEPVVEAAVDKAIILLDADARHQQVERPFGSTGCRRARFRGQPSRSI